MNWQHVWAFLAFGTWIGMPVTWAQTPLPTSDVKVPVTLRAQGGKLRIKNRQTGQMSVVDLSDEAFSSSPQAQSILSSLADPSSVEFSVEQQTPARTQAVGASRPQNTTVTLSPLVKQNVWHPIPYRILKLDGGHVTYEIGPEPKLPSAVDQARQRGGLKEEWLIRRLFEIGWKATELKQHDVAQEAFTRLTHAEMRLSAQQKSQARLGLAMATFHQKGCADAVPIFKQAGQDPKNKDDVAYFLALCRMNAGQKEGVEAVFLELAKASHPQYGDVSRFYLGVLSEDQKKWDEAQNYYLDTIDFAKDPQIAAFAKQRLAQMQARQASSKWFQGSLSLGGGYDSNVVSLPQELAPSDYNLSKVNAFSSMALLSLGARTWGNAKFENHVRYNFLLLHYLDGAISGGNDIQSHELSTSLDFVADAKNFWTMLAAYSSVYKGTLGSNAEYLVTPGVEVKWTHLVGSGPQPSGVWAHSLRYDRVTPKQNAASESQDLTANGYRATSHYTTEYQKGRSYGPGLEAEYHPAAGSENSYYSATLLGTLDRPVGPEKWALSLSQEAATQYSDYYQSAAARKDFVLRYRASVSRPFHKYLDARLQFATFFNLSTDTAHFQYNRFQLNLLLTASF